MKRIMSLVLMVSMLLGIIPQFELSVMAATSADGNWIYTLDSNSNATITGTNIISDTIIIPSSIDGYTVTAIGREAFKGKSITTTFVIPNSVTDIGHGAFMDCTGLTSITIPGSFSRTDYYNTSPFEGCTNLNTVILENGITAIPPYMFWQCTGLTNITIPNSVTDIGYGAFMDCTGLTNITIPNSVTDIGHGAFMDCTGLTSITIPGSFSRTDYYNTSPFEGCTNLNTVILENGITAIPPYMFWQCTGLANITIPNSVTDIGYGAFMDCTNFTICSIENAYAALYAIDNNIPFVSTGFADSPLLSLDRNGTGYNTNFSTISASGSIAMNLKYSIKKDHRDKVSDMKVIIKLPKNTELINSSLTLNGIVINNFTNADGIVTIPVTEMSGAFKFSVKPTTQTNIVSYAQLSLKKDNQATKEVIGIVNQNLPLLTISADDVTDSVSVPVHGIAPADSQVSLYVNNTPAGTVTANKAGRYSASVALDNPSNYQTFEIKAETADGINPAISDVMYQENAPVLTELKMLYNNKEYDLLAESTAKETITFVPSKSFTFTAKFRNADMAGDVYIVSDRNNVKKYMKAQWDKNTNQYIASGYFDETDKSYVPGAVTVEYIRKGTTIGLDGNVDFTAPIFVNSIPYYVKENANVTAVEQTAENAEYNISFNAADELGAFANKTLNVVMKEFSGNIDVTGISKDVEKFFSYFVEGKDNNRYYQSIDLTDPKKLVMVVNDISSSKIVEYVLTFNDDNMRLNDISEFLSGVSKVTGTVKNVYEIYDDDDTLRKQIASNPNFTDGQRREAYKKADELKTNREAFLALTLAMTLVPLFLVPPAGVAGMAMAPQMFSILLGTITASQGFFWNYRMANIATGGSGASFSFRWAIDPSGYVYEAVTANRLKDVKATVYFKEKPQDAPVEWNALEWEQKNPLYTDVNGAYAWDVPEGLWQVKYELDGYETAYSDWLPVPPPQTEVNIGMVSLAVPEIGYVNMYTDYAEIQFTKYMQPDTVSKIQFKDSGNNTIGYTLEYDDTQSDIEGSVYANRFAFRFNRTMSLGSNCNVLVPNGVMSYAGVTVNATQLNVQTKEDTLAICAALRLTIGYGKTLQIPLKIEGYTEGMDLLANTGFAQIAEVVSISEIDTDGNAIVTLKANMLGETELILSIEGTSKRTVIPVNVVENGDFELEIINHFVTNNKLELEIQINNNTGKASEKRVAIAVFDKNKKLINIKRITASISTEATTKIDETINISSGYYYTVKVFLWDWDTIEPVCMPAERLIG